MSNLGEMRTNVLLRLAESSGGTFTDVEINRMIQREYEYIQTQVNMKNDEYFSKQVVTNTVASNAYAFPTDLVKLTMVELKIDNSADTWFEVPKIAYHRKNEWDAKRWFIYNEHPTRYYIIGNTYYMVPAQPDGTNNLKLVYVYAPTKMTLDADSPLIPEQYHEIFEIGATNRLRKAVKEPPIDQEEYQMMLINLIETISPRVKHAPKQVRMVPGTY